MEKQRRKFIAQLAGLSSLAAAPLIGRAATAVSVKNIRLSHDGTGSRLVFDLDGPVDHKLFTLHNPERVVIDFKQTRLVNSGLIEDMHNGQLKGIRTGVQNQYDLRVVLDLQNKSQPSSFLMKPQDSSDHRLVVDLKDPLANKASQKKEQRLRDVVVAIDAGHGGNDPGATGRLGTHEKEITLQIARRLAKLIERQPGMKAMLVRNSDRFMRLRDRITKARDAKADLMISIHADSFPDKSAKGASVYALSVSGASSETARLLAEKENNVDFLFGNVSLDDRDEMVQQVLLDLSLTGTIQSSLDVGDVVLSELGKVGHVHKKVVQQAGFAVLKAPNIPAVLLETAFISNPREERKLVAPAHQDKLAKAILRGVNDYFARKAPPGTWLSQEGKSYTIRNGDTLADISDRFNTPVSHIRSRNALFTDRLNVGQTLIIPVS